MKIKTFPQIKAGNRLDKDDMIDRYSDLLYHYRQLAKHIAEQKEQHHKDLMVIKALKRSRDIAKAGRRKSWIRYSNAKSAQRNLMRKVEDEKNLVRKGIRLNKWNTAYAYALMFAFIESKKAELKLTKNELLLMIALYQYNEVKLTELYERHHDLIRRNVGMKSRVQPLVDKGLIIRHKFGARNTTLQLSTKGRLLIQKLATESDKHYLLANSMVIY